MFDFNNIYTGNVSVDEIFSKVSQYSIWKKYCLNFKEIDKSFLSEFYKDTNPSCRIYINSNNNLIYKDFGNGDHLSCFDYICKKYNCTFKECLDIICNDFNIRNTKIDVNPSLLILNGDIKPNINIKNDKRIEIVSQPFTSVDYDYWNQYYIPLELLIEYNVFSTRYVYLYSKGNIYISEYNKDNPIYSYRFTEDGKYHYKIYKPLADKKRKWLYDGSKNIIEGYNQLPLHGDILILTKSLKDCICYKLIDLPAISLQGETNKFTNEMRYKLLRRFKSIIVNYDNDDEGRVNTNKIMLQNGFKSFYIDEFKDLSDYIKNKGINSAKDMIYNKINNNVG